jgi:predicted permease
VGSRSPQSIIEVFLLCIAGYVLSRAGVTDKATQRKLNVINVSLFTPALLFSKVGENSGDADGRWPSHSLRPSSRRCGSSPWGE